MKIENLIRLLNEHRAEYLIIGGGGPGGKCPGRNGVAGSTGGGGAGEYIPGTTTLTVKAYPVTVGLGGTYGVGTSKGGSTTFDGVTAVGGGFGGVYNNGPGAGSSGGSGQRARAGSGRRPMSRSSRRGASKGYLKRRGSGSSRRGCSFWGCSWP